VLLIAEGGGQRIDEGIPGAAEKDYDMEDDEMVRDHLHRFFLLANNPLEMLAHLEKMPDFVVSARRRPRS